MNGNGSRGNDAELLVRLPASRQQKHQQKEYCCKYKTCPPKLSSGCDLCGTCGDYYMNPFCNSIGITGLIPGEEPCLLFDGQVDCECIGCKYDCVGLGTCAIGPSSYGRPLPPVLYGSNPNAARGQQGYSMNGNGY